jgi:hypothetical protein
MILAPQLTSGHRRNLPAPALAKLFRAVAASNPATVDLRQI